MAGLIDDDFNDNFTEKRTERPQPATPSPEELRRQREEKELKETVIERHHGKVRALLVSLVALAVIAVAAMLWLHYFHPYKISQERGVIMEMSSKGVVKKTFEGQMMSERLIDATHIYQIDFPFSVTDDSVAAQAARLAGTGRLVTVRYEEYKGTVLWRGETNRIVTAIDAPADSTAAQ